MKQEDTLKKKGCGKKVQLVDHFGQQFRMKLDGSEAETSYMGTLLTVILAVAVLGFLYEKFISIYKRQGVDISSTLKEFYHDDDFKYSWKDGLFIAAALTEYNSDTEILEEAKYGELTIEGYGWGNEEDLAEETNGISFHYCTDEELGLVRTSETVIYPWKESLDYEVETYRKKFKCIDKEDTVIWGNYNSAKAYQLSVNFRMCEGGPANGCETEENIRTWLRRKYIVLLSNQRRFDTEGFFGEEVVLESRITYIPLSS